MKSKYTISSVCNGDNWLPFSPLRIIFVKIPFNVEARTLMMRKHNPITVIQIYHNELQTMKCIINTSP